MGKKLLTWRNVAAAMAIAAASAVPAQAEVLFSEDFSSYTAGAGLYDGTTWMSTNTNHSNPILVEQGALAYAGYKTTSSGKAAKIIGNNESNNERVKYAFNAEGYTDGAYYCAFLVNITKASSGSVYFFSWATTTRTGWEDQKMGSEYGRVFTVPSSTEGKVALGFGRNSASPTATTAEFDLNTTHLVVLKYEFVDGSNNDITTMWLDPQKSNAEAAGGMEIATGAECTANARLAGFQLRNGSTGSKSGADCLISAIKVTDSWADLWEAGQGGGDQGGGTETPAITAKPTNVVFDACYQYTPATTKTVKVKGENLTSDVTVTISGEFTTTVTTIAKEDVMSADGYDVAVTLDPTKAGEFTGQLSFETEGASPVIVPLTASVTEVKPIAGASFINLLEEGDYNIYRYEGTATVTYIDGTKIYAQDATGGMLMDVEYTDAVAQNLKVGDKFTGMYFMVYGKSYGVVSIWPFQSVEGGSIATVKSQGNSVEPIEVTLSTLKSQADSYLNRVVKVKDVTFTDWADGFTLPSTGTAVSDASGAGRVRAFASSTASGMAISAASVASVTGISTSASAAIVTLCSADGVEQVAAEPSFEITETRLIPATEWLEVGKSYEVTKYTVVAKDLPEDVEIYLGGSQAKMFGINVDKLSKGTSTTEIVVTYTPTAVGSHSCNVTFNFTNPADFFQSKKVSANAYDPANPPTVTPAETSMSFTAKVGESDVKTLSYTAANLIGYFNSVALSGTSNGAFKLSTSSIINGQYNITVTFAPEAAGTYSETVTFSGIKLDPVTVTLTGTATGDVVPEQPEGDAFVLDTTSPQALVIENFSDCGDRNKPLSINGWVNNAAQGTRAWWAYTDDESNGMAKITGYDSKMTEQEDMEAILVSPALDFKNAAQPILTFDVCGKYMTNAMTQCPLEVCYIEPGETASDYYIQPIDGLSLPVGADYNDTWMPFTIDLKGLDLADVFFIGFRFKDTRGNDNSTTYFVDNFTWGRGDLPFIRPVQKVAEVNASTGTSATVDVDIEGLNLTGDIKLSFSGADAKLFSVSPETLPAEGGKCTVTFAPESEGEYNVYLVMTADGAPESAAIISGHAVLSGVNDIDAADADTDVELYNLQGVKIDAANAAPGLYLRRSGNEVTKVVIK